MPQSTQAGTDAINNADAHAQGLDGGLNLKTDPSRLAPPATTRADNAIYTNLGNVAQLPAMTSTMQANTQHVYNVHARDLQQPSSTGDVMVHGEVLDTPTSTTSKYTTPCWSDGSGATINTQQPMPPWNTRTKVLSGKFTRSFQYTDQYNLMTARQESGYTASAPQRYAMGYTDGNNCYCTFGLVDGQIETPETLTAAFTSSASYVEMQGVQGTNYFAIVWIAGSTINCWMYDFKGNPARGGVVVTTAAVTPTSNAAGWYSPFEIVQHAGRTYVAYITNPSGNPCVPTLYDIVSGASIATPMSSSNVPNNGFSCASPYTHQAPANPSAGFYLALQFANQIYLLCQTAVNGAFTIVGNGITLPTATNSGYNSSASPTGQVSYTSTMTANIFDSQGGVGPGAQLGITCFRHYPEMVTGTGWNTTWYQSLSVSNANFYANASSATGSAQAWTIAANNYVRMPQGVALCSKAWVASPPQAGYAGPKAAKTAYVLIRCGAFEPYAGLQALYTASGYGKDWTYSQPTYFIVDHQGRIVSRAFESQGPIGFYDNSGYATANQGYNSSGGSNNYGSVVAMYSLGMPLLTSTNNDLSLLDVMLPVWAQTQANAIASFQLTTYIRNYTLPPIDTVFQPCAITLTHSSQVANCPPVQAGPYTVLSGPMTCVHDGRGVVEASWHLQTMNPVIVSTSNSGAGNTGPAGTYYYVYVYEWNDALGRVHRSAPSVPVGVDYRSFGYFGATGVGVPAPVTVKDKVGGQLLVRLYRSLVNNTSGIFYQVATQLCNSFSGSVQYIVITDPFGINSFVDPQGTTYSSAGSKQLDQQPRVYIQAPQLDGTFPYTAASPPPFIWQCGTKGRSFGIAQLQGQHRLYYTSVAQNKFPFEWNTYNYAPVPPDIGDVRSCEAIDDKIILFGTRSNAVINGDGPPTGGTTSDGSPPKPNPGDGFSLVQPIPTPVGIIGSGAPTRIPDGIVFQGFSGIQLVGRDLTVQPIGAGVDTLTGRQVNNYGQVMGRGVTLASLQSVVWCNPAGNPLVYNYLTQRWSTWPIMAGASAMVQRLDGTVVAAIQPVSAGQYVGLATATSQGADMGVLGATWAPVYQGNSSAPGMVLESPWILPSGESGGESQLWDVTVTGGYIGPHILQVEQAYNYVSNYTALTQFNVATAPSFYQYRVRPKATARIWAVRYRITLLPISSLSTSYLMASLGDLVLNFGSKQGTSRLGAAASG